MASCCSHIESGMILDGIVEGFFSKKMVDIKFFLDVKLALIKDVANQLTKDVFLLKHPRSSRRVKYR